MSIRDEHHALHATQATWRPPARSPILGPGRERERNIELVIIFSVIALLAALARGGSLHRLASVSFRHPWLVFVGLFVQLAVQTVAKPLLEPGVALVLLLTSMALIAVFLLINVRLGGMGLAAVGLLLNVVVIAANGAMPVHRPSAEAAGVPISFEESGVKHEVMDASTRLPWLGDAIGLPVLKTVLSLGDVLLALGVALFVYRSTRGPTGKRSLTGASGSAPAAGP